MRNYWKWAYWFLFLLAVMLGLWAVSMGVICLYLLL